MTAASRRAIGASAALVFAAALSSTVSADHAWGDYHWARTANPFTIALGDNVTTVWDGHLRAAAADWTTSNVLDTIVVTGQARNKQCRPEAGRAEVCNASYGNNGWLGIAQIWASGSHITKGAVKMNDTYFNTPQYNTSAWRQFVVCQEVGHIFGLDHQDEVFTNPNLGTCMDYTNNPTPNQEPNAHDYEQLEEIYAHLDTTTTIGADAPRGNGVDLDNPSEWGRLMKTSHGGRTQTFERDFGQGRTLITHVIWAQPE
jgi:hypothetical protein